MSLEAGQVRNHYPLCSCCFLGALEAKYWTCRPLPSKHITEELLLHTLKSTVREGYSQGLLSRERVGLSGVVWVFFLVLLDQRLDQPDQMRDMKLVKQPDQHIALLLSLLLDHDHYLTETESRSRTPPGGVLLYLIYDMIGARREAMTGRYQWKFYLLFKLDQRLVK